MWHTLVSNQLIDVVSGDESNSKADLEKIIKSHGGSYEQTARNANYVIAGSNVNGKIQKDVNPPMVPKKRFLKPK